MTVTWTPEQILGLAPDASAAKAAKEQAVLRRWSGLGHSAAAAWGLCQGSAKEPYRAQIDLGEPAFRCTCPSRKLPCKHTLGLFLLLANQPAEFRATAEPAWVAEWLEQRKQRAEAAAERPAKKERKEPDSAAQAKRAAQRETRVQEGLADLELWLKDLLRQGLAAVVTLPPRYWETPAARLVDAQAPGLARLVRELPGVCLSGEGWQGRLLERLARLYLLLEAYRRIDRLPPPEQAGLRTLIGWTQNQDALLAEPSVTDRWLVVGQRVDEEHSGPVGQSPLMRVQRSWLWGESTGQAALCLHFAMPGQPLDASLLAGSCFEAELVYFPAAFPLRALVKVRRSPPTPLAGLPGYPDLHTASAAYAAALASDPWLAAFPLAVQNVTPLRAGEDWAVQDLAGRQLPLAARFSRGWELLALSGGRPLDLFGEWDGERLLPLSAGLPCAWYPLT